MRQYIGSHFLLVIALGLSGCKPTGSTIMPTPTEMQSALPTIILPTITPIPSIAPTIIFTSDPTLEPEKATEAIRTLLSESVDCSAPCFWGITPRQTTLEEAINKFTWLGLQLNHVNTQGTKEYYGVIYNLDNGLEVSPTLTIQNDIVVNLRVGISPENQETDIPREWLAYSPETLIRRYGVPSKVSIVVDTGPRSFFDMVIYFDAIELIVEYTGYNIIHAGRRVCPRTDQYDYVGIWMGESPENPPPYGFQLEESTYMSLEEFSDFLITENRETACFELREEIFP